MQVEKLSNEEEWEKFVADVPGGTFYHTVRWKRFLEESFSFDTEYLVIRDGSDHLAGVCPLAITRKLGFFTVLDSLPESDFGGPLVEASKAPTALEALNILYILVATGEAKVDQRRQATPQLFFNLSG